MSEYLLVVEGLAEGGADAALFVDEIDYRAAMFGCAFAEPVHGYVWCNTHGWVPADEACVCEECAMALMEEERTWVPEQALLSSDQYCRICDLYEQCGWDWAKAVKAVLAHEA